MILGDPSSSYDDLINDPKRAVYGNIRIKDSVINY